MDEREFQAEGAEQQGKPIGRRRAAIGNAREQLLAAQRARLEQVEVELSQQLDHLSQVVNDGLSADARASHDDLGRRAQELADQALRQQEEAEQLQLQRDEIARGRLKLKRLPPRSARTSWHSSSPRTSTRPRPNNSPAAWPAPRKSSSGSSGESEELERRREETKTQRRRIAQELKAQRAAHRG